jgi:hypothetical protein
LQLAGDCQSPRWTSSKPFASTEILNCFTSLGRRTVSRCVCLTKALHSPGFHATRSNNSPGSTRKRAVSRTFIDAASVPSIQNSDSQKTPTVVPSSRVTMSVAVVVGLCCWNANSLCAGTGVASLEEIGELAHPAHATQSSEIKVRIKAPPIPTAVSCKR